MSATLANISLTLILRDSKSCKLFQTRLILNHLNGVIIKGHEIFLGCYWVRGEIFFSLSKNGWHFSFEWKFLTQQWLSKDPFLKWTPENSTWPKWQIMAELVVEFQINVIKFYGFVYTARPRDTRFLVPEKNRAAENRASWCLSLCTKVIFFSKNRVASRPLFKIRVLQVF